ncbi:MAG: nucleotidyltransferase family protein [Oscillospiraceae bacterium]|nr:nucleotidyltransferase family protein [Oscillospiraceae bacterium]
MKLTAILLAAGLSRRMGTDKLLMLYKGKTLIQSAVDLLCDIHADEMILVTSQKRLCEISLPQSVMPIINHRPQEGQSGSVRIGTERSTGTHLLFLTADQPRLRASDITPMLHLSKRHPAKIIYPVTDGKPTTPTLFPAIFRGDLLSLRGDAGGRAIRDAHTGASVEYLPDMPEHFTDFDTFEDFSKIN